MQPARAQAGTSLKVMTSMLRSKEPGKYLTCKLIMKKLNVAVTHTTVTRARLIRMVFYLRKKDTLGTSRSPASTTSFYDPTVLFKKSRSPLSSPVF